MGRYEEILSLAEATPFVDTHEHLLEESSRLAGPRGSNRDAQALKDFSVLFSHYADSDLVAAGMPQADMDRVLSTGLGPREKWSLLAPWYERARHTAYLRNVRESLRILYGEEEFTADSVERISAKVAALVRPGYYREVLAKSGVAWCQVNTLEDDLFMETKQPALLAQDMSLNPLSTSLDPGTMARRSGLPARTLEDWHRVIDWAFETYGRRAIALKSQAAYERRLDFAPVPADAAAPLFERLVRDRAGLSPAEHKALQDHLFNASLARAERHRLPVKLHTGTYAGNGGMPLGRVAANAGDVSELLIRWPNVRFVIMHIGWPFQDSSIALAKHFANAWIDLCWAWIVNPLAASRFLEEFLVAAPASKVLGFGGDYMPVELVPGHARIAREGIARALARLEQQGWLAERDTPALLARIMHGNAEELFDKERADRAWAAAGPTSGRSGRSP